MKAKMLMTVVALITVLSLVACAAPAAPQIVEVEKPVTVQVEKVVTVQVEKAVEVQKVQTVVVEKTVKETVLVEKQVEKVVTATPEPKAAAAKNPFTPADDIVEVAHNQDGFDKLDIRQGYPDASALFCQLQILERLVFQDDKLQLQGQLAEKWEGNADSTEYTFTLKQGVKFQDGDPFNAAAVKKHFDFVLADPPCAAAATIRADIKSVDVVDDYTVKFTMKGPRPFFLYGFAESLAALIYSPKTVDRPDADRLRDIAGTGPFKIKEWLGQRDLLLEANPDYNWANESFFSHNGPPFIKTLRIRNAADTDARLVSLETGESHFITLVPDAHVARLKQDPNFNIIGKLVAGMPQMNYINIKIVPTNQLLVRQAINYATNKDEINQLVYYGNVEPAYGPLSKANIEYNPEVEKFYPYDLEKAKALLKEAGWWDENGDGIAEAHGVPDVKDGTLLEARIVRGRSWQQYSDVWQRQLSMAGFKASIIMLAGMAEDWYGCLNQLPSNGDVGVDAVAAMTRDWDKDQCFTGAMNFACTCDNPEIQDPIQEYLTAAQTALTMDERKKALGDLQVYIMEQALEVPIYELYWFAGALSSLKDVRPDASGFYYYFYDAKWER